MKNGLQSDECGYTAIPVFTPGLSVTSTFSRNMEKAAIIVYIFMKCDWRRGGAKCVQVSQY